jgi:hypothetical protein
MAILNEDPTCIFVPIWLNVQIREYFEQKLYLWPVHFLCNSYAYSGWGN